MLRPDWITHVPTTGKMQGPRAWLNATDYRLCLSIPEFEEYVQPALSGKIPAGLDWEMTGLNVWKDHLVGFSFSYQAGKGIYVPVGHYVGAEFNLPLPEVARVLKEIDKSGLLQIWYNYRFDSAFMLRDLGWEPTMGHWVDAMFGPFLEDANVKQYGLKFTSQRMLGVDMIEYSELVGTGVGFHMVPPEQAPPYACADSDLTRRIWFLPEVQAALKEQALVSQIEHKALIPIREGVDKGIWLDKMTLLRQAAAIGGVFRNKKKEIIKVIPGLATETRAEIFKLAGGEFDLDSPKQLGEKLVALGVEIEEKTEKTGQVSTGKEILEKYAPKYPICAGVVKYRKLETQRRNYIDKLIAWVEKFGPLARFSFNQIGAPTGRMSAGGEGNKVEAGSKGYADMNVQSIPDPEKAPYLPNIRSAFVANDPRVGEVYERFCREYRFDYETADPMLLETLDAWLKEAGCNPDDARFGDEWVIVAIDYSQIELRVAANVFREPLWIEAFLRGDDIHMINARLAYRDPTITKKDPRRKHGKTMNFATLYGAQADTVAAHGGITSKLAQSMMDNFFGAARRLKDGIESFQRQAKANGWIKTWTGRKRILKHYYLPNGPKWLALEGDRQAVNSPIQGGAADIFKIALFKVRKFLIEQGWHQKDWFPVLFVHDELVSIVRRSKLYDMLPQVVKTMEFEVKGWPVPIKADAEVGWNWGEMATWDDWQGLFPPSSASERVVSWLNPQPLEADGAPLYNPEDDALGAEADLDG